ncbi:splicing factor U2af large subunit A-like [Quercus robur]|uniref:splicing factor U2af large subunit A-like n=1 Tax=Quercus robur TaxID=38942 RepID=UPI0021619597|nr:splicing factor U2af large subunit A-like [Quercus robur]
MSEGRLGGQAKSGSVGSSRDSTWRERKQKMHEDRERGQGEEESGLGEGLVRDLELEAKGWRQRRDRDNRERRDDSVGSRGEESSSQSGPQKFRDRYDDRDSNSPEEQQPYNAAMDEMSQALQRAARSPFSNEIEQAPMPSQFTRPPFNSYDGKTDPVEHISHYIHMMSLHAHNDALMCKVFLSSLSSTALRWFNGLWKGSIRSFAELI